MPKINIEAIGKILATGFGDRVLLGIFMGLLDNVTPARCYEYIRDNKQVGHWLSGDDWDKYGKIARGVKIVIDMTRDDVIDRLRKHRPDMLDIIINTPGGMDWLQAQIDEAKKKLGL